MKYNPKKFKDEPKEYKNNIIYPIEENEIVDFEKSFIDNYYDFERDSEELYENNISSNFQNEIEEPIRQIIKSFPDFQNSRKIPDIPKKFRNLEKFQKKIIPEKFRNLENSRFILNIFKY